MGRNRLFRAALLPRRTGSPGYPVLQRVNPLAETLVPRRAVDFLQGPPARLEPSDIRCELPRWPRSNRWAARRHTRRSIDRPGQRLACSEHPLWPWSRRGSPSCRPPGQTPGGRLRSSSKASDARCTVVDGGPSPAVTGSPIRCSIPQRQPILPRLRPATRQPRSRSIQIAWPPPCGRSTSSGSWPMPRQPSPPRPAGCRARSAACPPQRQQPRQVDRLLDVQPVFQQVGQEPGMPHRLVMAAHHPERHHGLAILHQHAGDDRVHRPLARGDAVRMPALHPEAEATVLQHHARFAPPGSPSRSPRTAS